MFRKRLMTESNLSNIQNAKDSSYFYYSEYMADIFTKKLEERYGGRLKCNRAAKVIQNAFRMYCLKKKLIHNANKEVFRERSKRNRSLPEKLDNLDDQYDTPYSSSDSVNWCANRFKMKRNRISMFDSMNYGSSRLLSDSPCTDSSDECDYENPQSITRSTSSLNNKRKQISHKNQSYSKIQIGDSLSCKCEEELERYQTSCHGSRSKKSTDEKFDDDSYTDSCSSSSQSSSVGKQNSCVNINNKREINKNEMLPPPMPVISPQSPWKPSLTTESVLSITTTTNSVASINSNTTTSSSTATATSTTNIVNIQKSPRDSGFSSHSSNTDLLLMSANNIGVGSVMGGCIQDGAIASNQNQASIKFNNPPSQDSPRLSRLLGTNTSCKPTSIPSIMTSSRDSGIIENNQPQTPQPHPSNVLSPFTTTKEIPSKSCTLSSSTNKPSCNCSLVATILTPCSVVTSDANSGATKATTLLLRSPCVYVATSSATNNNNTQGYLDNRLSYIITSSNSNDVTLTHNPAFNRQISNTLSQSTNASNDYSSIINRQSSDDSYKSRISSTHSNVSNSENKQWIRNILNRLAINLFNRDASVGLEFLRDHNLLSLDSPNDLAQFLQSQQLHPKIVTEFFTAPRIYTAFHIMVFKSFIRQLNLDGFDFLDATEIFLSSLFIPTDPSKLQFLISEFTHYFCTNLHSPSNCCKGKLCNTIHEKVARIIALLKISIQQSSSVLSTPTASSSSSSNQNKTVNFSNANPCFSFADFVKKITGCYKSSKLQCPYTMDYLQRSYINLTSSKLPINRSLFSELLVNRIESFPSQSSQAMVTKDKKSMVAKEFLGDKNNKSVTKFYFQAPYRRVTYFCDIYQIYTKPPTPSTNTTGGTQDKSKIKQHSRTLFLFNDSIIITKPLAKSPGASSGNKSAASSGSISMRILQAKFRCEDIVSFLHYEVDLEYTRQNPSQLQLIPLKSRSTSVTSSNNVSLPPLQFNCVTHQNCAALTHKMLQSQLECRCIEQMRSLHWRCHHNNHPSSSTSSAATSTSSIQSLHNCLIFKIINNNIPSAQGD